MIIVSAVIVLLKLKISFNVLTKLKWFLIMIAVLMRLGLSIYEFIAGVYKPSPLKFYYVWLMEQVHFMIILMMFFSVVGSWHLNQKI